LQLTKFLSKYAVLKLQIVIKFSFAILRCTNIKCSNKFGSSKN